MSEYKNQHYVPQHLLRGWTDDERLPIYNLKNEAEYPKTHISNLCSEAYFYGDAEAERSLDGLEERHSSIIKNLRSVRSFNALSDEDIIYFCMFILLQRNRTKQTKKESEELIDNLAKEYLEVQVKAGNVDPELPDGSNALDILDDYKITHERPLALPMLEALTGVDLVIDLEIAIIENKTEKSYIISDHPVVHDNRRFKHEYDRFLVGLQSKGLQIFLPLSDEIQIMLYDPTCYRVEYSNHEQRRVSITSEKAITGLNDLQLINAFESVYYRESGREEELKRDQQRLSEYIKQETTEFNELSPEDHDFDTDNEIIESRYVLSDYSPYLPFVKRRKKVKFDTQRRPQVLEAHREFMDELLEEARNDLEE